MNRQFKAYSIFDIANWFLTKERMSHKKLQSLDACIYFVYTMDEVKNMTTTIQKWGNSQGIRLPKIMLDDLSMSEGDEVEIFAENNAIVIRTATKKRKSIQALFVDYEGDYEPESIDWGAPVGKELW